MENEPADAQGAGNPLMLKDVKIESDPREIAIEQVGVSDLQYPVTVLDRADTEQRTIANITLSIGLPHDTKGADMSRFTEALEQHRGELTMRTIPDLLADVKEKLDAESARIEIHFPYFLERCAPATGTPALMDYECSFVGEVNESGEDFVLGVSVPVTSLCPRSKALSDRGARNQRACIQIKTRSDEIVWIEELVEVAESSASAPIYPLLKRADERHVTMEAYDNPVFVEDMVRNVAVQLRDDARVNWFQVRVDNHESIYNHNAFAQVTWAKIGWTPSA